MNSYLIMGLFALYVVFVSLLRLLADKEVPRLAAMKRFWGWRQGLLLHFATNVALPLVFGVVFLGRGIATFGDSLAQSSPTLESYAVHSSSSVPFSDLVDCISLTYTGECGLDAVPSFLLEPMGYDPSTSSRSIPFDDRIFLQP